MKFLQNIFLSITFLTMVFDVSSQVDASFFEKTDAFLKAHIQNNLIDYQAASKSDLFSSLISSIENVNLTNVDGRTKQAFYVNAYNLLVIQSAIDAYPTKSVLAVKGFFDSKKHLVAGEKITLDELEKERLFQLNSDPRFHFVLVCGALGCPPLASFAYIPTLLENQLESQTKLALNDPNFIRSSGEQVQLSKIFQWYAKDFGGSNAAMIEFINIYRSQKIPSGAKIGYYEYDWTINDTSFGSSGFQQKQGNSANRNIVSKASIGHI
jgi:hypothetical protein